MDKLIMAIDDYRKENLLKECEIAELLGVNPSRWSRIKHGKIQYGAKFLRCVRKVFPDIFLTYYVMALFDINGTST